MCVCSYINIVNRIVNYYFIINITLNYINNLLK